MQHFDFDKITPRRGSASYKWDTLPADDIIPMWVADMDFMTAPAVIDALRRRIEHGVFGYVTVPQQYYDAVTGWFHNRHGWRIDPSHIIYTTGVVPALSAIIKGLTKPGDKVIIQTPAYNCFFSSIRNNGCQLSANPLIETEGRYMIDFDDLERRADDPDARLMIICNPHNPTGRLWSEDELRRIAAICRRHDVIAVSDEIHCELTYGALYHPFAPIAEAAGIPSIVCVSHSKAFNTAGLHIANIVATDPDQRARIDRAINDNEVCDVGPFGVVGLIAAYTEGAPWLDSLRDYLHDNYLTVCSMMQERCPEYTITPLEATYLMWIDITPSGMDADALSVLLMEKGRVKVGDGAIYGDNHHIRLNIACPRQTLVEGVNRIAAVLESLR